MKPLPTKVPGIPKPPASAGPELRRYLEAVSEALEIRLGRRGDPVDRAVTLRELIKSGLARELKSAPFDPNNVSETTIGFVDDGQVDVTNTPPTPTGFTASGGFRVVNLLWDYPLYTGPNHSHTEIYSYPSDSLADAIAAGVVGVIRGRGYSDPVGGGVTRYYWIRHVNEAGTVGPWNSTSGTIATTSSDVDELLETLTDSITSSQLATSLTTTLDGFEDDIADLTTTYGSTVAAATSAAAAATSASEAAASEAAAIGAETDAIQAAADALLAQTDAETAESNAQTSETNAATSESNAATSASAASTSATGAAGSASAASQSASTAASSETAAGNSASAAATSATNAATYATSAGTASTAASQAQLDAETAESNAQTAESNAASSATNAAGSASTAATQATNAANSATAAGQSAGAASTSASNAASSATSAGQSATASQASRVAAETAETNAETAETNAATSASAASQSASNATASQTAAGQSASAAATSETNAATSASNAGTSETNAATSESNASGSASSAATSATNAANSATAAGNSASAANTSASNASTSASDAGTSATAAAASQTAASTSETNAGNSETNAASSASAAATSASTAAASETNAGTSASSASTSATTAATQASSASTFASNAATSATNAANSASSAASTVNGLTARLDDVNNTGSGGAVTVEQAYSATATNSGNITDLQGQYTVKIDANGHVAGFGLANTATSAGGSTSEFFVNADKFAILPDAVTTADAAWSSSTTYSQGDRVTHNGKLYQARVTSQNQQPPNTSYWDDLSIAPFVVTSSGTTVGGVYVPAGVYINSASIKHASITSAQIGSVNADTITTGTLNVADRIDANAIDASKLVIDGSSLTSTVVNGTPTLQLGSVNVNTLTGSSISATIMSGTTVYADNLTGDVSVILPFRSTTTVSFAGNTASNGGTKLITTQQLPATSHLTNGHKPYASVTGWYDSTSSKTYSFKLYMRDNAGSSSTIGTITLAYTIYTTNVARVSGNVSSLVASGDTVTATGKSHTVTSVTYDSSNNWTNIAYTIVSGSAFATGETISNTGAGNYQLVGETRFKANTNLYAQFSLSGSLSNKTLGTVDMKLEVTRTGASGVGDNDNGTNVDYIHEVSGFIMGAR